MEEKLHSLTVPTEPTAAFIADIFGKRTGAIYKEGLVDCGSKEEFDIMLHQLETVGNTRELPFATSRGPVLQFLL